MIRNEHLQHYIGTIAKTLAGAVMSDVRSPPVKELVGVMLIVLDRILTDLTVGDQIAESARPGWERLREQAGRIVGPEAVAATGGSGWQALDREFAAVQKALGDRAGFERFVRRLRDGDGNAKVWLRDMSHLLANLTREFEERMGAALAPAGDTAAAPDRAADLRRRLDDYLARGYPGLPQPLIESFAIVSGGQSKLSALFTVKQNDRLPTHLALRLDIPNTATPMKLDTEYPVLKRVFELGLPVPEPLLFEPDPVHLGGAFLLSTQVRDARIGGSPFVEDRRKYGVSTGADFGREAAKLLAKLHGRTHDSAQRDDAVARERDALVAELSSAWHALEKTPLTLQRDLAIAWLYANPLPPGRPVCLVHGDFAQHNILTRDGQIVALLDWELARLSDPAEDLALCKMMLVGDTIEWDEFLRVYYASGGPPRGGDPHAVAFYAVLLYLKHGVYQTRLRNQFEKGEGNDIKGAVLSGHFVDRLALYQAEALRDALATAGGEDRREAGLVGAAAPAPDHPDAARGAIDRRDGLKWQGGPR